MGFCYGVWLKKPLNIFNILIYDIKHTSYNLLGVFQTFLCLPVVF